jgi:acetylornithine deacetylase/succinyl-diaminopimelate desuccinylase-like protein
VLAFAAALAFLASPLDAALRAEATVRLQALIRVDTSNPPGNETPAARELATWLQAEGIETEIIEALPGRGSVFARLPAATPTGLRPFLLHGHLDVVPARPEDWSPGIDPFAALEKDGVIYGRGAIDDKGMVVAIAAAMIALKREGVPLTRDLWFLASADEEVFGPAGPRALLKLRAELKTPEYFLGEGGFGLRGILKEGLTTWAVSVAEKGGAMLHVVASGEPGHGMAPRPGAATDLLVRALDNVLRRDEEPFVTEYTYETLARLGAAQGFPMAMLLGNPWFVRTFAVGTLEKKASTRATIYDTCALTRLEAGYKDNVIPGEARAVLDCRLLPGTTPAQMAYRIQEEAKTPGVKVKLQDGHEASTSPWRTELFSILERRLAGDRKDAFAAPILTPGNTDARWFREAGVTAYGIVPFEISQAELDAIHGKDERLPIEELHRGAERIYWIARDLCATSPPSGTPSAAP